jgi:6-phosphofructokinase 2
MSQISNLKSQVSSLMSTPKIATLTLNPALDKSTSIKQLVPDDKLRCEPPVWEPGGGGINVSRAIKKLGGESICIYLAGGATGDKIQHLLDEEGIRQQRVHAQEETRENLVVTEKSTEKQFRFGMPGAEVSEEELNSVLKVLEHLPDSVEYLVASGSLPKGAPADFYGKIAKLAQERNMLCVIDTSGEPLKLAAQEGLCLMKPNLKELSGLAGYDHIDAESQEEVAKQVIQDKKASMLAVSLGARGAMLATKNGITYVTPPTVKQESTVGAGDSMVAGMVLSLSRGESEQEMIRWGVAAGTAATMTPGSELCRKEDVEQIYNWIKRGDGRREI